MADKPNHVVLSAVGPDRPGIVQHISELIRDAGGNIEDSRMAILGGEFALILLFTGTEQVERRVESGAATLGHRIGLSVNLRRTSGPAQGSNHLPYRLRVSGVDHPGIVFVISEVLAGRKVNVASLDTELRYAPLSGTPMFVLSAILQVPSEVALSSLRSALAAKCDEENLDFTLESG